MNRRRFVSILALALTTPAVISTAQHLEPTPPPDYQAPSFEAVRYLGPDAEDVIRSIEVRTSTWPTPQIAGAVAGSLTANVRPPVPVVEFYPSNVESWPPRLDIEADAVSGRYWHTIVGVAAFQTFWAQIVVWQGTSVTVSLVSGAESTAVQQMATAMMRHTLEWIPVPCGSSSPLPTIRDVPKGMTLHFRATNDGVWNDAGTPIADPWQADCVPPVVD